MALRSVQVFSGNTVQTGLHSYYFILIVQTVRLCWQ